MSMPVTLFLTFVLKSLSRFVHLLLLTSERAWAQAMHMKSTHSADGAKNVTGSTKRHIGSRLNKASVYAGQLVDLLKNQAVSKASTEAILGARAYYVSVLGAYEFEKHNWERSLHGYSEAHLIYAFLAQSQSPNQEDLFRDLLNATIDPSIRYAAYQLKLPRTTSIDTIVSNFVPHSNNEFVQEVLKKDPDALKDHATSKEKTPSGTVENLPKTIQWRSRTVSLEDAATAQALAAVSAAGEELSSFLSANVDASPQARGAAYDEVLIPSQDAVDATKTAIDELSAEGVSQGDRRMQSLQITRTAVNYALVGWRVGRNRVLCGTQDGSVLKPDLLKQPKKPRKDGRLRTVQEESTGRKLVRLKERVVLYDSTLQSLDSVKELPGVAADQNFLAELESKRSYFAALRCLSIARSHILLHDTRNALALLSRSLDLIVSISQNTLSSDDGPGKAPNLDVTPSQVKFLKDLLHGLVFQHRALVELHSLEVTEANKAHAGKPPPLVERLDEYPRGTVDLTNLVTYPPKMEPIPVKPLFLDVAFNYIDYPGRTRKIAEKAINGQVEGQAGKEEKKEGRKGWFGFGR